MGFGNFNVGTNQDFHFENPTMAPIPEPSSLCLLAAGAISECVLVLVALGLGRLVLIRSSPPNA